MDWARAQRTVVTRGDPSLPEHHRQAAHHRHFLVADLVCKSVAFQSPRGRAAEVKTNSAACYACLRRSRALVSRGWSFKSVRCNGFRPLVSGNRYTLPAHSCWSGKKWIRSRRRGARDAHPIPPSRRLRVIASHTSTSDVCATRVPTISILADPRRSKRLSRLLLRFTPLAPMLQKPCFVLIKVIN
jgi:hypothetical protein